MNTKISSYEQQAIDFLTATSTSLSIEFLRSGKYFDDDKEDRDIYKCVLQRGNRRYEFEFGNSIANSGFYYQYKTGKTKFPIDRSLLSKKGLSIGFHIKMKDHAFVPSLDIIHYPKAPTSYDILACLTKSDPNSFEDFCSDFGYDADSRKAEKTYNAVKNEWQNVCALFTDAEIEQLQEIQ